MLNTCGIKGTSIDVMYSNQVIEFSNSNADNFFWECPENYFEGNRTALMTVWNLER